MTRLFTDRYWTEWRIEWRRSQPAVHISPGLDIDKVPLPPGGLHFESQGYSFSKKISEIDPKDLTELELQRMIDDAGPG